MSLSLRSEYRDFLVDNVLNPFYQERLRKLRSINLHHLLKRKNPYLLRAKNIQIASDLIRNAVDAFVSSQEETVFGNYLEQFAIYVSFLRDGGQKSKLRGIDLEFARDRSYFVVSIKSGVHWGNADQINAMKRNFAKARLALAEQGTVMPIVCVNGCIYGQEAHSAKSVVDESGLVETYFKYAGQAFSVWR